MKSLFTPPEGTSVAKLVVSTIFSATLTIFFFSQIDESNGIPEQQSLGSARGTVASVEQHKYGVRFTLFGQRRNYNYPSKARGNGVVAEALSRAGKAEVQVLYSLEGYSPLFGSEKYFDVWEIVIDGRKIRSFHESAEGWRRDNAVVPWLGTAFLLGALYLGVVAYKAYKAKTFAR